jgi:hypothetical protein
MNRVHRLRWETQPLCDRGHDLFLPPGVQSEAPRKTGRRVEEIRIGE